MQLKLIEASPTSLATTGQVKNITAFGSPRIAEADAKLDSGTRFVTITGVHAYEFKIAGDGIVTVQAFDVERGVALAPAKTFGTDPAGHSYVFGVP